MLQHGHFVVKKIEADYFAGAKLGDELEIYTKLIDMKLASFKLLQTIFLKDKKIFELNITLAYVNFKGKAQKIDETTKKLILSLF